MTFVEKVESSHALRKEDTQNIEVAAQKDSSLSEMMKDDSVLGVRVMHSQGLEGVLFLRKHTGRGWNDGNEFGLFYSLDHSAFVDLGNPPNPFGYTYSKAVPLLKEGGL